MVARTRLYVTLYVNWLSRFTIILTRTSLDLRTKAKLIFIYTPSPHRAVNTLRLHYTNQSINVV